ncbi:MAG: hypothetical protein IKD06_04185 [Clostridia bacterium]|nr:hypothetical protein [Clostridia bacterium]
MRKTGKFSCVSRAACGVLAAAMALSLGACVEPGGKEVLYMKETYKKQLPELVSFEKAEDLTLVSISGGEGVLSADYVGHASQSAQGLQLSGKAGQTATVSLDGALQVDDTRRYDIRWHEHMGFAVDLNNPNDFDVKVTLRLYDSEAGEGMYATKELILRPGTELAFEWMNEEITRFDEVDLTHIDKVELSATAEKDFVLYTDNWRLLEPYGEKNVYYYDIPGASTSAKYNETAAFVALQGVINRMGPALQLWCGDNGGMDNSWWKIMTAEGYWLNGYNRKELKTFEAVVDKFADRISGVIIWDEAVPATINVASTLAGVFNAVPVVYGSAEYELLVTQKGYKVLYDLRGKFDGKTDPAPGVKTTGSPKNDAYLFAKWLVLDAGLCDPLYFGEYQDSYIISPDQADSRWFVVDRDAMTAKKGFMYDLNYWPNISADDEVNSPAGVDYNTTCALLDSAWAQLRESHIIEVLGCSNFYGKYTSVYSASEGEWGNIQLITEHHGMLTADAECRNASFYYHAPQSHQLVQNAPSERAVSSSYEEGKVYVMIEGFDYDGLCQNYGNWQWMAADRTVSTRLIPVSLSATVMVYKYSPAIMQYYYDTKTEKDFIVGGPSGVGYVLPSHMDERMVELFAEQGKHYYSRLNYKVANFNIDNQIPDDSILEAYSTFATDGYGVTNISGPQVKTKLVNRMVLNVLGGVGSKEATAAAKEMMTQIKYYNPGMKPGDTVFYTARFARADIGFYDDVAKACQEIYADYNFEFVDPYTYYYYLREYLGGDNNRLSSVTDWDVAERVCAQTTTTVTASFRNDGRDTWKKGDVFGLLQLTDKAGNVVAELKSKLKNDVKPLQTAELSFDVTWPEKTGDYNVKIQMSDGEKTFEEYFNVAFETKVRVAETWDELPGSFRPLTPTNQVPHEGSTTITFKWEESQGAQSYKIVLARDKNFKEVVETAEGLTEATYTTTVALEDGLHFWKVEATNGVGSVEEIFGSFMHRNESRVK